jgi:hypothetical protein
MVEKPEGNRPVGRLRFRRVDHIKKDFRWGMVIWTGLIWLRI